MTQWIRGYREMLSVRRPATSLPFHGVTVPPDGLELE